MLTINVTQHHIDDGVCQSNKCPVALAIMEHLIEGLTVQVCDLDIRILSSPSRIGPNVLFVAATPLETISFIYKFDEEPVKGQRPEPLPFEFHLDIPTHYLK